MKSFLQEVSFGLSKKNKKLNSKWFYDFYGSKIFEQITKLEEYYLTRTERKILQDNKMVWYQSIYIHQNIRKLEGTSVRTSM